MSILARSVCDRVRRGRTRRAWYTGVGTLLTLGGAIDLTMLPLGGGLAKRADLDLGAAILGVLELVKRELGEDGAFGGPLRAHRHIDAHLLHALLLEGMDAQRSLPQT